MTTRSNPNPPGGGLVILAGSEHAYRNKSGKTYTRVMVKCPVCHIVRPRNISGIQSQEFTGMCRSCRKGKNHSQFTGRSITGTGYISRRAASFDDEELKILGPMVGYYTSKDAVLEHRAVMALYLGRPLNKEEVVKHLNGNKQDNRIENLAIDTLGNNTRDHHNLQKELLRLRQQISWLSGLVVNLIPKEGG